MTLTSSNCTDTEILSLFESEIKYAFNPRICTSLLREVTAIYLKTVPEVAIVVHVLRHDVGEQEGVVHRFLAMLKTRFSGTLHLFL